MDNPQNNTELDPDFRQGLDNMFNGMKKMTLLSITPELLRKRIKQIKDSNTDADKSKLSHDEAVSYLTKSLADPPVVPTMAEFIKKANKAIEHNCSTDLDFNNINNPMLQAALDMMGSQALDNIKFSQDIASIGNKPLDSAVKKASGKLFEKMENQFGLFSESSPESSRLLAEKTHILLSEIAKETQTILNKNPDIKKDLLKLPDMEELGRLNADDACKAISGHGIGGMKM